MSIIVLLLNMVGAIPVYARFHDDAQARGQKVKEAILKLGTGEGARVQLTLRDGRKLKGYVRKAGQDTFVVVDPKTGADTTVAYTEVKEIKPHKLSAVAKTGLKLGAVVGIGLALSVLLVVVLFHGEK